MEEPVLVVGAGGHAKVVIELLRASGLNPVGLLDADAQPRTILGVPVIGDDAALPALRAQGLSKAFAALGNNALRVRVGQTLRGLTFDLVNAISPAATISPSAQLGVGVAIMAGARINAEARIGDFCILNTGAILDHDGVLDPGSHVGPGCALAGNVHVGSGAFLGAGVSVVPGVKIGEATIVGAGALLVKSLPAFVLAYGVPARIVRRLDTAPLELS